MVSGWNECDCVAEFRAIQVENLTVLSCYEAYIYYDRSV